MVLLMSMMPALAFSLKVSWLDLFQWEEVSFEWCGDDIVRYDMSGVRGWSVWVALWVMPCFFAHDNSIDKKRLQEQIRSYFVEYKGL